MFFELQLSSEVFTRIVRNRFKSLPICPSENMRFTRNGEELVVDRILIRDTTEIQREQTVIFDGDNPVRMTGLSTQNVWIFSPKNFTSISVPFLQVKQEIEIQFVKIKDLEANGINASQHVEPSLIIAPVFNVALSAANQTQGGGPITLSYSFAYIEFGFAALGLSAADRQQLTNALSGMQLPPTEVDTTALTALLNRPVSAVNAGIACDPAGTFVAMRVEFDVFNSEVTIGHSFFEAGPTSVLAGRNWAMLVDERILTGQARQQVKDALQKDPKTKLRWGPNVSWNPGGPSLDITAGAELVDACPFFVDDIDMDVEVDITLNFSAPSVNVLRWHYTIEGSASNWLEKIGCALTASILWPFIGPILLEDEEGGIAYYFAGIVSNYLFGPGVLCLGILAAIETKGLSKDLSKDLGATCKKLDDENYECDNPLNIVMQLSPGRNSQLQLDAVSGSAQGLVLSGTLTNIGDFFLGSLEPIVVKNFSWQVTGSCLGHGKNNFSIRNQATISVFATPPAAMCNAKILEADDLQHEFTLTRDEYTVTIVANGTPGYNNAPYPCRVWIMTNRGIRIIIIPPPLPITEEQSDTLGTARVRAIASCKSWEKWFNPVEKIKWVPDPPFGGRPFIRFWQIVVKGLDRQTPLRVKNGGGKTHVTANPSATGMANLVLMLDSTRENSELSLEMEGERKDGLEIATQQVLFEYRSTITVSGPLTALHFEGPARARRLVVRTGDTESTWDLRSLHAPALLQSVTRQAEHRDLLLHNGRSLGSEVSPHLERLVDRLQGEHGRIESAGTPALRGLKNTVYIRGDKGAFLYDLSKKEAPVEIQRFEEQSWMEGVAMEGKMLAKYNENLGVVELFFGVVSH